MMHYRLSATWKSPPQIFGIFEIRRRAAQFIYYKDTLYWCSYKGLFIWSLVKEEFIKASEEAYSGVYSDH